MPFNPDFKKPSSQNQYETPQEDNDKKGKGGNGMTRRDFLKTIGIIALGVTAGKLLELGSKEKSAVDLLEYSRRKREEKILSEARIDASERGSSYFRKRPFIPTPREEEKIEMKNLSLHGKPDKLGVIGASAIYGKIERALRYKVLTDSIEDKYGLPRHSLIAIMIIESGGRDVLPNAKNDGGIGLCHMQPPVAKKYGLDPVIGDDMVDEVAGEKLRKYISKYHEDPIALSRIDQRFNPLANLDAAARFLMYWIHDKSYKSESGRLRRAFRRYSGRYRYWEKIRTIYSILENEAIMRDIEKSFNERNENLIINGKRARSPLADYWETFWKANRENYKLDEYLEKNPEKFDSEYLKSIRQTLPNFLIRDEKEIYDKVKDLGL